MYQEHPVFTQPTNLNVMVWRYMDFTKLMSMLDSRQLFFTRADLFEDPFEGSWPKPNVAALMQVPQEMPPEQHAAYKMNMSALSAARRKWPKCQAINCWHMNEHESAAMWKLYLKSDEGIAVQSTYKKFRDSITTEEKIFVGQVQYIDYDHDLIDQSNMLTPLVYKRKSFEHEREVRAILTRWPSDPNWEGIAESGVKIDVQIEQLIDRIYIAPTAPEWFTELVRSVVRRYGYNFPVAQSRMNEQPMF